MNTRHDRSDGPDDIDAAFAEIVAGLEREGGVVKWPDSGDDSGQAAEKATREEPASAPDDTSDDTAQGPRDWAPSAEPEDEGHYEPPEPPPLPTPRPSTLGGIVVIAIGLLLLLVPALAGIGSSSALPIGLIAVSAGIIWLLLRMRQGPPTSGDDGARL
ncbi:hypothetical protein A8924_2105 [Saccharopolyspora erythraea NRRL 2338]|uniref:Uncharacterized protein n=2 Tax=Saccharopolyspora erythraea TaxID=1836 RepID=A4FAE4_SACEN|nr:hypothetical protein [Saccharopolyspora erythraea]EQD86393.1 hypothetical protein N599_09595 [Saccharopolyspora erythraea D]PFG94805.1 hypothetical protein A8924_2105 [Saccharopolyspora erythraea NRRL 2338]QRK91520.1 DUF308 domain-containing protein [Saccharopolyspora erythraea]CAM01019.1 hypothetical protein SACE_1701 [Saccharopolyspora erythraea NRRL 2338]